METNTPNFFSFDAGVVVNNELFFSSNKINALYKLDLITENITFLGKFLSVPPFTPSLHKKCLRWKDKLLFLPQYASFIDIWTLTTQSFDSIPINHYPTSTPNGLRFGESVIWNDTLWIFPISISQPLLKIDLNTQIVHELFSFNEWCKNHLKDVSFLSARSTLYDTRVYLGHFHGSEIIIFDLKNEEITLKHTQLNNILGIYYINNSLWEFSDGGDKTITELNTDCDILSQFTIDDESFDNRRLITTVFNFGNNTFALSAYKEKLFVLDRQKQQFVSTDLSSPIIHYAPASTLYSNYDEYNNGILIFPRSSNGIIKIDSSGKLQSIIKCEFNLKEYKDKFPDHYIELAKAIYFSDNPTFENTNFTLTDFLDIIKI